MAVICVMPIFSSEIQNPIYVEKGVIISPFMGRSFPEYTYSDTTDFLAIRKRSVEIDGDAEMADYEKRSTTITAQESPSRCLITTASARRWTGAKSPWKEEATTA